MKNFKFELLSIKFYVIFAFASAINKMFFLFLQFVFSRKQDDSAQV